jgi:hypothetical protein
MCCLCIQFTHENTSERTILHLVKKYILGLVACTAKKASYALEVDIYNTPKYYNEGPRKLRQVYYILDLDTNAAHSMPICQKYSYVTKVFHAYDVTLS